MRTKRLKDTIITRILGELSELHEFLHCRFLYLCFKRSIVKWSADTASRGF
jgi:hypothetical protein